MTNQPAKGPKGPFLIDKYVDEHGLDTFEIDDAEGNCLARYCHDLPTAQLLADSWEMRRLLQKYVDDHALGLMGFRAACELLAKYEVEK